jgi:hypothetical protein
MSGYNGWTNYETWNVALWLDNDEALCNHIIPEMADDVVAHSPANRYLSMEQVQGGRMADALRDFVTDPDNGLMPDLGATMASDLLGAALSEVNWREIADHYLSDARARVPADADDDTTTTDTEN